MSPHLMRRFVSFIGKFPIGISFVLSWFMARVKLPLVQMGRARWCFNRYRRISFILYPGRAVFAFFPWSFHMDSADSCSLFQKFIPGFRGSCPSYIFPPVSYLFIFWFTHLVHKVVGVSFWRRSSLRQGLDGQNRTR